MIPLPSPPWTGLGRRLESATRKAIYDFQLLNGVSRLALAISGGKDSLTMLLLLHAISGRGVPPFEIVCLHVGGDYSCGASIGGSFLADFCAQLHVPLIGQPMPALARKLECYSCSRSRRKLLFEMAHSEGCSTIAFGHHRDDNAQTTLMNLLHKGEFSGLLPKITLHKYESTIIRPLIYLEEKDIKTFSVQCGFARISCRCPAGQHSLRKKTDLLLDILAEVYPNARGNVAHASLVYGSQKATVVE